MLFVVPLKILLQPNNRRNIAEYPQLTEVLKEIFVN